VRSGVGDSGRSKKMRGRFGEIYGKYIEIWGRYRKILDGYPEKEQENPWKIREDFEQEVHGRYRKIQYGMFREEAGRSMGDAE
jgi:hypothetical protein